MKHLCLLGFLLLGLGLLPSSLFAQQETNSPAVKSRMDVPAPLGGLTPQLNPVPDGEAGTVFTAGLKLNARHEDNVGSLDGSRTGHFQYSVLPSIGLRGLGHETQWVLNYTGGITFDQGGLQNDLIMHEATAELRHEFNKSLAAELRQDYLVTNSPFARLGTIASLPALDGPGELSSFIVPSTATRTVSVSMASLGYQLGPHSAFGVNGNLSMQRFRNVISTSGVSGGLIDTRSVAGRAFFVRKISPRQTIGAEYQLQDLRFLGGEARAADHTLFLFDELSLRSDMKLSLFAGPDHSHTRNVIFLNSDLTTSVVLGLSDQWSWAGGAMYTWQGKHTGFRASVRRGVSDGGGFTGAVRLTTEQVDLPIQLNARWNLTPGASYSDGRALGSAAATGDRITSVEGHFGVKYRATRDITFHGQYAYVDLINGLTFSPNILGHHNQIEIGLDYQFHRTLSQ
jgi:hypothetical protein